MVWHARNSADEKEVAVMTSLWPRDSVAQYPDGHGSKVPIEYQMCYAPCNGMVTAVVEYHLTADGIVPVGYAIDEETRDSLPSGDDVGGQIAALWEAGKLVDLYDVIDAGNGYLRIDDNRPGHGWSYTVWLGDVCQGSISFMANTVYHSFGSEKEDEHPRLESFDEVEALINDPNAKIIEEVPSDIVGMEFDSAVVVNQLGDLKIGVVVWDLGSMQRHARERQAADLS